MRSLCLAVGAWTLAGCALTDKAPPVEIRYFSPEHYDVSTSVETVQDALDIPDPLCLRLGKVTSSAHLRSRIAYRTSGYELGTYDTLRWTENPEEFVRRAIERSLFEQGSLSRVDTPSAPTLDVELVLFDELRSGKERAGQIAIRYSLWANRRVLAAGVISLEKPATATDITGVVSALSLALQEASDRLAEAVTQQLSLPTTVR